MEWTVITVLIAVAGLLVTVGAPTMRLNASITRLTTLLDIITSRLDKLEAGNHDSHQRIWDELVAKEEVLQTHEKRIGLLEHEHRKNHGG